MRTFDDIAHYLARHNDLFGHAAEVLVSYLPAERAKAFCEEGTDLSDWKQSPLTREQILGEMKGYMEFAWGKVEDHRGISANRSIDKMKAWLWLLEDDDTWAFANSDEHYAQYGAPILKKICEQYQFPIPKGDAIANMAKGRPCTPDCDMGCGA